MMQFYLQMIETPEDQSKFEALYHRYRQVMYAVAFKILKHPQDAEDAVHTAFVRIAGKIHTLDDSLEQRVKAFVITVTEHVAIDIYRQKHARALREQPLEELNIAVSYPGHNALADCLAKLPPRNRTALLLKYEYGYTQKEVAQLMHITEANVKNLLHRGKQQLAELYEKEAV